MTTPGIDISGWQTTTPSLTGQDFVFARATYRNYVDAMWQTHAANVKAAGKVLGAYHFLYLTPSVDQQVAAFLATATQKTSFLVLDVEGECNSAAGYAMAKEFIAQVHAKGYKIGLYQSQAFFHDFGQDFDWVAKWSSTPPTIHWDIWQNGSITIGGKSIDADKFNGDLTALKALVGSTQAGGSGNIDLAMGFQVVLTAPVVSGKVSIAIGIETFKVFGDGTAEKLTSAVTGRDAVKGGHVGGSSGYLFNRPDSGASAQLYFVRAADASFVPLVDATPYSKADLDAAVAAAKAGDQSTIDSLNAKITADQADLAKAVADLATAAADERERIALALAAEEADRVRATKP